MVKHGYKQTEIGIVPDDWAVTSLVKKYDLFAGGDITAIDYTPFRDDRHQYPVYSNALQNNGLYGYCSEPQYNENSITITGRGNIGHSTFRETPFSAIVRLLVCQPKEKINSLFVAAFLEYTMPFVVESTGVPQLTVPQIKSTFIPEPTFDEQNTIATALSDIDTLITNLKKLIAKKKAVKQGAMQELLTGKRRLPGFDDKWCMLSLKKLFSDFIVPMRDKPRNLCGPIPWCRIEDFDGKYLFTSKSSQGVNFKTVNEMNLKIFPVNTLLVSCSANLGRCAIVKRALITNQTFIGLVPSKNIDVEFAYYKMSLEEKELNGQASGSTISYLSREQFEDYVLFVPPTKEEQFAIASILSDMDSEITGYEQKLLKYKNIKSGMISELLTGRIRLIDKEDA